MDAARITERLNPILVCFTFELAAGLTFLYSTICERGLTIRHENMKEFSFNTDDLRQDNWNYSKIIAHPSGNKDYYTESIVSNFKTSSKPL